MRLAFSFLQGHALFIHLLCTFMRVGSYLRDIPSRHDLYEVISSGNNGISSCGDPAGYFDLIGEMPFYLFSQFGCLLVEVIIAVDLFVFD